MGIDRELRSFNARPCVIKKTIAEADLAAFTTNGAAAAISLGTLLPNAVVLGRATKLAAYFTGGGATTCTLQIGTAADPDAIMAALNILDTTTLSRWLQGTAGIEPVGPGMAGTELLATLTPDAGHNLAALTAGSLEIQLYVSEPDPRPGQF
jgi:hypothetical protein